MPAFLLADPDPVPSRYCGRSWPDTSHRYRPGCKPLPDQARASSVTINLYRVSTTGQYRHSRQNVNGRVQAETSNACWVIALMAYPFSYRAYMNFVLDVIFVPTDMSRASIGCIGLFTAINILSTKTVPTGQLVAPDTSLS